MKDDCLCSHPARHCVPAKPRRACAVLTGGPENFKIVSHRVKVSLPALPTGRQVKAGIPVSLR